MVRDNPNGKRPSHLHSDTSAEERGCFECGSYLTGPLCLTCNPLARHWWDARGPWPLVFAVGAVAGFYLCKLLS